MSFGGPIDSMINSQKGNRRLLVGRKKLKEIQENYKASSKGELKFKEPTEDDKIALQRILEKREREQRRKRGITLLVTATIVILLLYLLYSGDFSSIIEFID